MYDKPNSQYSQFLMAAGEAETETLDSTVPEVRVISAVAGNEL